MTDPTPADPGTSPAETRVARRSTRGTSAGGITVRILLTVVGVAAMIVGALTRWLTVATTGGIAHRSGLHLSLKALYNLNALLRAGHVYKSVGAAMIVLAVIALIGLAPRSGWLTRLAAVLGVVVFVLFAISVVRSDRVKIANIGFGVWLALAGSVVAFIGGFFGTRARVVEERAVVTAPPA